MSGGIYNKPVVFALVVTVTILVGTLITTFVPLMSDEMHPKLENLKPFTALELAGRDIYQREGCVNCHTQTVRPLKTEVMRYGEYSKAGEFYYDRPFLWGSKRTGPDLARIGGKYPDAWHYQHFADPESIAPKSNMPIYGWMKGAALDSSEIKAHMDALKMPYAPADIDALKSHDELDALVAYLQSLGHAVRKPVAEAEAAVRQEPNPFAGDAAAAARGKASYDAMCGACHGAEGKGGIGPSLVDTVWLGTDGDVSDGTIYTIISDGTHGGLKIAGREASGGMPPFGGMLQTDDVWALVTFVRSLAK